MSVSEMGDLMLNIRDIISGRLRDRGLAPIEITRLIRDVSNVADGVWYYTPVSIKYALERLGWEGSILDNYILELIFLFLNDEKRYEMDRLTVH